MDESPFDWLPVELHVRVLVHVPAVDLSCAACVCREWSALLKSPINHTDETEDEDQPAKRARTDETLSVWKEKARTAHATWYQILCISGFRQDFQWLCLACERTVTQSMVSNGYTGVGCIEKYHSNSMVVVPVEQRRRVDEPVVGSVQYQHTYVGDFVNGQFDGFGMCVPVGVLHQPAVGVAVTANVPDGTFDYYCGYWKTGAQDGEGQCGWGRGDSSHRGEYRKGMRHGHGHYEWDSGRTWYTGDFHKHAMWGHGTLGWRNGKIVGQWKLNKQHGHCTITWTKTGCKFVGEYKHGNRKSGTYTWIDGGSFTGKWKYNVRSGKAEVRFANGLVYEGMYNNDVRHGPGKLTWPDGDSYRGTWSLNRRWGPGTFTCARTGETLQQEWREDASVRYTEALPEKYAT